MPYMHARTHPQVVVPGPAGSSMQRDFAFHACLGPDVSQSEVLQLCGVTQLLDAALSGYNVTIFAYGQTGAGGAGGAPQGGGGVGGVAEGARAGQRRWEGRVVASSLLGRPSWGIGLGGWAGGRAAAGCGGVLGGAWVAAWARPHICRGPYVPTTGRRLDRRSSWIGLHRHSLCGVLAAAECQRRSERGFGAARLLVGGLLGARAGPACDPSRGAGWPTG